MKNIRCDTNQKKFFTVNAIVLLIASFFLVLSCCSALFNRPALFYPFSHDTLKFIVKTLSFFLIGCIVLRLLFTLLKITPIRDEGALPCSKKKFRHAFAWGWRFYFVAFLTALLKGWAIKRFPMDEPELVYYTTIHLQGGFERSIIVEIVIMCLFSYFVTCICKRIITVQQNKHKIYFVDCIFTKRLNFNVLYLLFGICALCLSIVTTFKDLQVPEYFKITKKNRIPPIDSQFYRNEYYAPEMQKIIFPDKKKNLIIIFLESMESSFADTAHGGYFEKNLIPQLTNLAEEQLNFSHTEKIGGGTDLAGSGWTVAAMLSKLSGLPFNLVNRQAGTQNSFLPAAVTLNDILAYNGYRQLFIFGSDKHFEGRDALLETHGNVEIHDINWYKDHKLLPKNYRVFWGFEDQKLYAFAKTELEQLGNDTRPFMFGILTVDTHMPKGYRCERCPNTEDMQLKNVIRCADAQVGEFIDWCKVQPWFDDTMIVITGDHRFMATKKTSPFKNTALSDIASVGSRRWLNVFINAQGADGLDASITKNRNFASVDMFPTILAAMGCTIPDNRLGFGVNLFSGEKTLCERYSEEYLNQELMKRNIQYEALERPIKK